MSKQSRTIKSVVNAFKLINTLEKQSSASLSELASAVGLSKGTTHTYLSTLQQEGYIKKEADKGYRLSLEFLSLGNHIRRQRDIYKFGKDEADELAQKTSDATHLAVESDGIVRMLYSTRGNPHSFKGVTPSGGKLPMHASATGKAIIAKFPEERVAKIIDEEGLQSLTAHTITDHEDLFEELARIRDRGYADNRQEQTIGAQTLATDVQRPDSSIAGAIAISCTISRFEKKGEKKLADELLQTANQIEINLQRGTDT